MDNCSNEKSEKRDSETNPIQNFKYPLNILCINKGGRILQATRQGSTMLFLWGNLQKAYGRVELGGDSIKSSHIHIYIVLL